MFDPKLKEALGRVQKPGRYTGGEPGSVYKDKEKVDVRFAFCLFSCTVTFVCALLSFYFSRRMKQKNTFLFGLICLAMCGLSSYPVLHMLSLIHI